MKTAVVTGAGRGIGLEIARKLGARGYQVLVTTRDPQAGRAATDVIGPSAWSTTLDVRDPDAHHRVAEEALARGPLAVWVNNAGVLVTKKAWEHEPDEIQMLVETNVIGMISGSLAALKAMDGRGSRILNVASLSGLGPVPGLSVYAATKHAIVGFTTSLQGDLDQARRPIRVHALCPGPAATEMVAGRAEEPDAAVLFSARQLTAEEVADQAIALLAGRRIVHPMPRSSGMLVRCAGLYPEAGLRAMAVMRSIGERRVRS
jgi:NAD(P)-dependent dehydrogenase (short-subunit alcohol dehydrogenase family)